MKPEEFKAYLEGMLAAFNNCGETDKESVVETIRDIYRDVNPYA